MAVASIIMIRLVSDRKITEFSGTENKHEIPKNFGLHTASRNGRRSAWKTDSRGAQAWPNLMDHLDSLAVRSQKHPTLT